MDFPQVHKNKVRAFLRAKFHVEPTETIVLESCQSLFYLGRAHARCEALRKQRREGIRE